VALIINLKTMSAYSPLQNTQNYGLYKNTTASVLIKTGTGNLQGVIVNSHSSGTLKFWDNTSGATTVIFNTITLAAGERWIPLFGAKFTTGCYLTVGGTADVTVVYN
jgi:hypothetical protein